MTLDESIEYFVAKAVAKGYSITQIAEFLPEVKEHLHRFGHIEHEQIVLLARKYL